jgi:hypothetical protein
VIEDLDRNSYASIDTTDEAEQGWAAEMAEMAAKTLYQHTNSWYVGANIPGKPRYFMIYIELLTGQAAETVRVHAPLRHPAAPGGRPHPVRPPLARQLSVRTL